MNSTVPPLARGVMVLLMEDEHRASLEVQNPTASARTASTLSLAGAEAAKNHEEVSTASPGQLLLVLLWLRVL
jgi:hypothetical protein